MEKLLKKLKNYCDQAEIYVTHEQSECTHIIDKKIKKTDLNILSGTAIRFIRNGKIGFTYTRNILDEEKLIKQLLISAENGVKAEFDFPSTVIDKAIDSYDTEIENTDKNAIFDDMNEKYEMIDKQIDAQIHGYMATGVSETRILNTSGTDLYQKSSEYYNAIMIGYTDRNSSLDSYIYTKKYQTHNKDDIQKKINLFKSGMDMKTPRTGRYPVIFSPLCISELLNRFIIAAHPASFYSKTTPLMNAMNSRIFSEKLTIFQQPKNDSNPGARLFDDEGVECRDMNFVEDGIFKGFYTNLNFAGKLQTEKTGNGFRSYGIEHPPVPTLSHLAVKTGEKSLEAMIESIEDGLIVFNLLGGHSGNVLAGEFSVGVGTGFYIKNGKVIASVKDCMLAGNIYQVFDQIREIEDRGLQVGSSILPSILFDNISVSGID